MCRSNNSPDLKINVSTFMQNDEIVGKHVEVYHPIYETLFAYTITPKGGLITEFDDTTDVMHTSTLLNELKRYGFYVDYVEEFNLSSGQIDLLRTVSGLHYDKLRLVAVHEDRDYDIVKNYIIAFNMKTHSQWLNSNYSPSRIEFNQALLDGSAFNISNMEYASQYNWSWIYNAVFDIDEILSRYDNPNIDEYESLPGVRSITSPWMSVYSNTDLFGKELSDLVGDDFTLEFINNKVVCKGSIKYVEDYKDAFPVESNLTHYYLPIVFYLDIGTTFRTYTLLDEEKLTISTGDPDGLLMLFAINEFDNQKYINIFRTEEDAQKHKNGFDLVVDFSKCVFLPETEKYTVNGNSITN